MKTLKKIIKTFTSILLISAFLIFIGLGAFFINSISNIQTKDISTIVTPKYSLITDSNSRIIEDFRQNSISHVDIEEIPQVLKDALISIEDREFYIHNGINEKRILSSLISNLNPNNNTQGGSTLTQQLVKNLLLTNEKSYKRKIQEAYLSILLEKELTKDEILELYFNRIYFEQSIPGIQYACNKFFNKDVKNINLPEAALLVGLVKSPSYYYPLTNPDRANQRKNEVLKAMLDNNKISKNQYDIASSFPIEKLIYKKENTKISYPYQSYLDIVYKEVKELTNYDLFNTPLKIETYIDTYLQSYIDEIQKGNVITLKNEYQQIGGVVLDKHSNIIGIIGGRDYNGKKLYSHAFDIKTSPASTIKPILSYALGIEYLHLNTLTTLEDKEYYYPNSTILVNNADKSYLGKIPLIDALGYSRNTCAVSTLEKVISKIGQEKVVEYLAKLNIMDEGPFTYSYAIGGMKYGTSPINIAGAYSMLLNNGYYVKPSTIKKITNLETNEIIYEDNRTKEQLISEESSDIMTNTLERIVDSNYLSMKEAKPNNIKIAGKTGTGAYPQSLIKKYNLPSNADKDIWFSGYSPNYTCSIWSGFDEIIENKKTYFSGKEGKNIPKLIFKELINLLETKKQNFEITNNLTKVYVVKGLDKAYLPNDIVPSKYIDFAYYKKDDIPSEILPYPTFNKIEDINVVLYENTLYFSILNSNITNDLYSSFYGDKGYLLEVKINDKIIQNFYTTSEIEFSLEEKGEYQFSLSESYKNNYKLKGDSYQITYLLE